MDVLDESLTTDSLKREFSPSLKAAIGLGKKVVNKYYNLTDTSEVYRIAMGAFLCRVRCVTLSDMSFPTRSSSSKP